MGAIGSILGIISAIFIALLIAVLSPVFTPFSENIKDTFSSLPVTEITSAKTFDNVNKSISKIVQPGDTIASNFISFEFNMSLVPSPHSIPSILPLDYSPNFECSLDGTPFQDCVSPKSYDNLETEAGHTFQVRGKGILGNIDKTPAIFSFTTITSASIEGIIKRNNTVNGNATLIIDTHTHKVNSTTDIMGRFQLEGIGQGKHEIIVNSQSDGPRKDYFFVPEGKEIMTVVFDTRNMSPVSLSPSPKVFYDNINRTNPNFDSYNNENKSTASIDYPISLALKLKWKGTSNNPLSTNVWVNTTEAILSKIDNVTYFLHDTFEPNVITVYTRENAFALSFNNWGVFDLKARVYFLDGTTRELEIPSDKWDLTPILDQLSAISK